MGLIIEVTWHWRRLHLFLLEGSDIGPDRPSGCWHPILILESPGGDTQLLKPRTHRSNIIQYSRYWPTCSQCVLVLVWQKPISRPASVDWACRKTISWIALSANGCEHWPQCADGDRSPCQNTIAQFGDCYTNIATLVQDLLCKLLNFFFCLVRWAEWK